MAKSATKRQRTRLEQNKFVRGLITEASPLTFPEDASIAEENFELKIDGSRFRRLGIDFEPFADGVLIPTHYDNPVTADDKINTSVWNGAGASRTKNIGITIIGNVLRFHDNDAVVLSDTVLTILYPNAFTDTQINSVANGFKPITVQEYLIFPQESSTYPAIGVAKYNEITGQVELLDINGVDQSYLNLIMIRDLFGVGSPLADDVRPLANQVVDDTRYNLRNQGWTVGTIIAIGSPVTGLSGINIDPAVQTEADIGVYPSNADTMYANKIADSTLPEVIGAYSAVELSKSTYGNQLAPKGRFVISAFKRGAGAEGRIALAANATYPLTNLAADSTVGKVSAIASYQGRVVYSVEATDVTEPILTTPDMGSMFLYSQISEKPVDFIKCHTVLDPTAGDEFSPLATDGGFFFISEIGKHSEMHVMGNSLYILADNGVWQVNGGDGIFTNTNQNINKVTNIGSIQGSNSVVAEDKLYYQTRGGIYVISAAEGDNQKLGAVNITQTTIQKFYDDLSEESRENSDVVYDEFTRQIKWLFYDDTLPSKNFYNIELVLDLNLEAFSLRRLPHDVTQKIPYVIGYNKLTRIKGDSTPINVIAGVGNTVVASGSKVITVTGSTDAYIPDSTKYWVIKPLNNNNDRYIAADYRDILFRDWGTYTDEQGIPEIDAAAFLLTGYVTGGQASLYKRVNYLTTYMRRLDFPLVYNGIDGYEEYVGGGCLLQGQWEWTDSVAAGRWTKEQQIYKLPRTFVPDTTGEMDYGHPVIVSKNKLRGKGRALSLLFKTEPRKFCQLYGWSYEINAETEV